MDRFFAVYPPLVFIVYYFLLMLQVGSGLASERRLDVKNSFDYCVIFS